MRWNRFGLAALLIAALAPAVPAVNAAERILKFGAPFPSGSSLHKGMLKFKDLLRYSHHPAGKPLRLA